MIYRVTFKRESRSREREKERELPSRESHDQERVTFKRVSRSKRERERDLLERVAFKRKSL